MKTSCTHSATFMSGQAATTAVGTRRPTSSAWDGPESAATTFLPPSSSSMTCVSSRKLPFSMPFETETTTVSGSSRGAIFFAVSRTAKLGVARTTSAAPFTQLRSLVSFKSSGIGTPLSIGFSFAARIVSLSCCEKLQSVTSFPFSKSRSARAVPQPPLPTTAIFIVLTVPFILSAPSCDIRAAPEKRAGKWNICFSEAASRETAPRAFTPLGLS